jgi:hypothetical protein
VGSERLAVFPKSGTGMCYAFISSSYASEVCQQSFIGL